MVQLVEQLSMTYRVDSFTLSRDKEKKEFEKKKDVLMISSTSLNLR